MPTAFRPADNPSPFRRIAASMWGRPADPSIYGFVDIDVSDTLRFVEQTRARTGQRITMTHIVARAVANAFAENPDLNAKVRFGGRIEQRETVDLVISVMRDGGRDLSAARVDAADTLDLAGLVDAVSAQVDRSRKGEDEDYEKSRGLLASLPWWLVRPLLWLTDVSSNELHLHLPKLGMPRDPFGTAVITNVGRFGIDTAFAPFVPLGRCPMLVLVTEVKDRAVVVDGRVEARPILRLCATFDHRIVDGAAAGRLAQRIVADVSQPGALALEAA
ncbi:MAG: 2-oxo acid dehydrogenase subunit E2 [Alphaproteobacteria bacterium]|nr:2-oxo acid dehydrogenase subunit E2 [Alphaproteobacteria bacterium]